jgi:hypothetical protein
MGAWPAGAHSAIYQNPQKKLFFHEKSVHCSFYKLHASFEWQPEQRGLDARPSRLVRMSEFLRFLTPFQSVRTQPLG